MTILRRCPTPAERLSACSSVTSWAPWPRATNCFQAFAKCLIAPVYPRGARRATWALPVTVGFCLPWGDGKGTTEGRKSAV